MAMQSFNLEYKNKVKNLNTQLNLVRSDLATRTSECKNYKDMALKLQGILGEEKQYSE